MKKYVKFFPKIQTVNGTKISAAADIVEKFQAQVKSSSVAVHEGLTLGMKELHSLVSKEKLLGIESRVNELRRCHGHGYTESSKSFRVGPVLVSWIIFFIVLFLPVDFRSSLDPTLTQEAIQKEYTFLRQHQVSQVIVDDTTNSTITSPLSSSTNLKLIEHLDRGKFDLLESTAYDPLVTTPISSSSVITYNSSITTSSSLPIFAEKTQQVLSSKTSKKNEDIATISSTPVTTSLSPTLSRAELKALEKDPMYHEAKDNVEKRISDKAHVCFALLLWASISWITEAIPYYCTALMIPPLVVLLGLATTNDGTPMSTKEAAIYIGGHMFSQTSFLILLGFAISSAFCKAQFELRIAAYLQSKVGHDPKLFILAVMMLGLFLSAWLNNHTGPILCVSILLPILSEIDMKSSFLKCLLSGLAFACNIGGMATPISSLQSILSIDNLASIGIDVNFGSWLVFSTPLCIVLTIIAWVLCLILFPFTDVKFISEIIFDKKPLNRIHVMVLISTLIAIGFLALMSYVEFLVGGIATVSMMYLFFVFSTGILTTTDLNSFNWHLLILLGGGSILGTAVKTSKLLDILAVNVLKALRGSPFIQYIQIIFIVVILTSCISHTIGSLILMPLIVHVGLELDIPTPLTISAGLAISVAMALPFSSFPNLNILLVRSDSGYAYVKSMDIMKGGIPLTFICYAAICLSYPLYGLIFPTQPNTVLHMK